MTQTLTVDSFTASAVEEGQYFSVPRIGARRFLGRKRFKVLHKDGPTITLRWAWWLETWVKFVPALIWIGLVVAGYSKYI